MHKRVEKDGVFYGQVQRGLTLHYIYIHTLLSFSYGYLLDSIYTSFRFFLKGFSEPENLTFLFAEQAHWMAEVRRSERLSPP